MAEYADGRTEAVSVTGPLIVELEGRDTMEEALVLGDEVLTPDSSRFWPAESYHPGRAQFSFDKQFVRDYLESIHWNKQPPAPPLPEEVAENTAGKYRQAYQILTGRAL